MSDKPNPNVPQVQEPVADLGSLLTVVKSLKQGVESLGGYRGVMSNRAVTFNDLRALGLIGLVPSRSQTLAEVPKLYSELPAAPLLGQEFIISDALSAVWGSVVTGGGVLTVRVWWNGTDWTVLGR